MGLTPKSRDEVQFVSLLSKTRALENESWRKPHFYQHLRKLHAQLKDTPGLTADDRVAFDKAMSELDKVMAALPSPEPEVPSQISQLIHRRRNKVEEQMKTPEKWSGITTPQADSPTRAADYEPAPDVTEALKRHKERQAQLADQMLAMTQNLKHVSVAARDIITQDNSKLSDVHDLVDKNQAKLGRETEKLEKFNQSSGKCWVWTLVFVVMAVFIVMVIFIRLFPKRK